MNFIKGLLYKFLFARSFTFTFDATQSLSFHKGVDILSWNFFYINYNKIFSRLSSFSIRLQKLKLKIIIKNCSNLNVGLLINKINQVIFDWSKNYNVSDFFLELASELDIYLHRILWRWARNRHPRRPNTWVYEKYWKEILGFWKFFTFNTVSGKIIFLRSHCSRTSANPIRLPISLVKFDLFNILKFRKIYNYKFFYLFHGVVRLLWKKQNGLCFVCNRSFIPLNFINIKVYQLAGTLDGFSRLILLHNYCSYF